MSAVKHSMSGPSQGLELVRGLLTSYDKTGFKLESVLIQCVDEVSNGVLRP